MCSDDDGCLSAYQNFITDLGCEVLKLPELEKATSSYYDLAVMSKSKIILQSMRNSAFSNYAAAIGEVPIHTVYDNVAKNFLTWV